MKTFIVRMQKILYHSSFEEAESPEAAIESARKKNPGWVVAFVEDEEGQDWEPGLGTRYVLRRL